MIDVVAGKNTYRSNEVTGFQNIRAYVSGTERGMTIEFRAEAYTEPHSGYMILIDNEENEVTCSYGGRGMFEKGFQENVHLSNGEKINAFFLKRSEATSRFSL